MGGWRIDKSGNLTGVRGDTGYLRLRKKANNVPVDLTGVTVKSEVRSKQSSSYVVFEWTPDYSEADEGYIILTVTDEITKAIKVTEAVWDIQLTWPSGKVETLFGGSCDVEITKDATL